MKKPDAINFSKKNSIRPFEDASSLEFFAEKQDASLFVIGSHSKKRPDNLVFARTFDHKILDMVEVGVSNYQSCKDFKVTIGLAWLELTAESRECCWIKAIDGVLRAIIRHASTIYPFQNLINGLFPRTGGREYGIGWSTTYHLCFCW